MRADRLIRLLLLLQMQGTMTAQELARELEVSERTVYRDIDALSGAGVPVYAEIGPGGGYGLLESYRTSLTGLTDGELRALFLLSIPEPLAELGVAQELQSALLKLVAAQPVRDQPDEGQARRRIHIDSVAWHTRHQPLPHLPTIQQAVWEERRLALQLRLPHLWYDLDAVVEPYGIVAKAGDWHLVYAGTGRVRVCRVVHVTGVRLLPEWFVPAPGFDLVEFWRSWCAQVEQDRQSFIATVRVAPALADRLPAYFGDQIRRSSEDAGATDTEDWITLDLPFESLGDARTRLLGFGGDVEVLAPEALRLSLRDFAAQVVAVYGH